MRRQPQTRIGAALIIVRRRSWAWGVGDRVTPTVEIARCGPPDFSDRSTSPNVELSSMFGLVYQVEPSWSGSANDGLLEVKFRVNEIEPAPRDGIVQKVRRICWTPTVVLVVLLTL